MSDPTNSGARRSRVIPADEVAAATAWAPAAMSGGGAGTRPSGMVTAKQLEQIQRQAYDEGFAQGRSEGLATTRVPLESVLRSISQPLSELDEACLEELVVLVKSVARQLVRRELRVEPGEIMAVVREALASLPSGSRAASIHLHPEDARLVREALSLGEGERQFRIVEDPAQERGGGRVQTETSVVDASLETRLNAVVSRVLGGSREDDAGG